MLRILKKLILFACALTCLPENHCDKDCLLQKNDTQLSTMVFQPSQQKHGIATIYVYGINTRQDENEFQLLDFQNFPNLHQLTAPGQVCASVTTDIYRHGVILFTKDDAQMVMDIFVLCTLNNLQNRLTMREQTLENLILQYIINTPQRVLGNELYIPNEDNEDSEHCLDEDGFIADPILIDGKKVTCFTFITPTNTGAYLNNRLVEADVDIYAGPLSVNRIDQTKVFKGLSGNTQNSILALFYQFRDPHDHNQWFCDMYRNPDKDDFCFVMTNQNYYGVLCCCPKRPITCAFHTYQDPKIVCARGKLTITIEANGVATYSEPDFKKYRVHELKKSLMHKSCVGLYKLTKDYSQMEHEIYGIDDNSCSTLQDGQPLCTLQETICPTIKLTEEAVIHIKCCCKNANLCNIDFTTIKAFERLKAARINQVCYQPMIYNFLFTKNYTIYGSDTQVLCPVQYDPALKKIVNLQTSNNMIFLRDVDYRAYQTEGCTVVAAIIKPIVIKKCPNDVYTMEATKVPRPIVVCTCKGQLFNTVKKVEEDYCDVELTVNIEKYYNSIVDSQMPKCLELKSARLDEYSDLTRVIEAGEIVITESYIFCYAVISHSEGSISDLTAVFSVSSGVASIESGYSYRCFDLYNKASSEDRLKPLCSQNNLNEHYCCAMALEGEAASPRKLLYLLQQNIYNIFFVVNSTSAGFKNYKHLHKTSCLSSLNTQKTEMCDLPMGCFWTETSDSNRVSEGFHAGCISRIPEIVRKGTGNIEKALRTCLLITTARRTIRYQATKRVPKWYLEDTYNCFATNQQDNLKDDNHETSDVTSVFVVCCCTELSQLGECTHDEQQNKRNYGVLVSELIKNAPDYDKSYAVPL